MDKRVRSLAVLSLCVALGVSACGTSDPEGRGATTEVVPAFDNFVPNVWSADAGVDLFSRGSELLRAAFEPRRYWPVISEVDDFFPGYTSALVEQPRPGQSTRFAERAEYLAPLGETVFAHITDYSATDTEVSGTVCSYMINTTEGRNWSVEFPDHAYRIVLKNRGESPGLPGVVDSDPERGEPGDRTPSWDVFGSWKIQPYVYLSGSSNPPANGGNGIPPGCQDWWLQQFPELIYETPTAQLRRQPKGFVAPVMPLGVQYPGWIGPADVS